MKNLVKRITNRIGVVGFIGLLIIVFAILPYGIYKIVEKVNPHIVYYPTITINYIDYKKQIEQHDQFTVIGSSLLLTDNILCEDLVYVRLYDNNVLEYMDKDGQITVISNFSAFKFSDETDE